MKYCWERTQDIGKDNLKWGQIGPRLVKESVEKNKLEDYVQGADVFCPVDWWEAQLISDKNNHPSIPNHSYSIHLWNEKWRNFKIDKNENHPNSLYDVLRRCFL